MGLGPIPHYDKIEIKKTPAIASPAFSLFLLLQMFQRIFAALQHQKIERNTAVLCKLAELFKKRFREADGAGTAQAMRPFFNLKHDFPPRLPSHIWVVFSMLSENKRGIACA